MLQRILIFLAGVLVGANLVYFLMTRYAVFGDLARTSPVPSEVDPASRPAPGAEPAPAPARPADRLPSAPPPQPQPGPAGLIVPVAGVAADQLSDTFTDARGTDRVHDAIDIMAPRGTPVLAVAEGKVEKLFTSEGGGGLTVYQFDPSDRYAYYYAHLDRYVPGLAEGQMLRQGDLIGYVGSTGNAAPDAPHLHFAIFVLGPEKQWWNGTAINPYPLLRGAAPTRR